MFTGGYIYTLLCSKDPLLAPPSETGVHAKLCLLQNYSNKVAL